jgi:hypothetical protein
MRANNRLATLLFIAATSAVAAGPATPTQIPADWRAFTASKEPADRTLVAQIQKMDWWDACIAWGKETRHVKDKRRLTALYAMLVDEKLINAKDIVQVQSRAPAIGMTACGVMAALGSPNEINQTKTAGRHRAQLVYRSRNTYVYTEGTDANGIVTGIQF